MSTNYDIYKTRFLSFDLEMTGLNPYEDSIIEIAAVPLLGNKIEEPYFFSPLQPYSFISSESKKIHGLNGSKLLNAPPAEVVIPEFFRLAKGRILLGQNPGLDIAFLWQAAKKIGDIPPEEWAIDISKVFNYIYKNTEKLSLETMAKRFEIRVSRTIHNALEDTIIVAEIFQKITPMLYKHHIRTLNDLITVGKTTMKRH